MDQCIVAAYIARISVNSTRFCRNFPENQPIVPWPVLKISDFGNFFPIMLNVISIYLPDCCTKASWWWKLFPYHGECNSNYFLDSCTKSPWLWRKKFPIDCYSKIVQNLPDCGNFFPNMLNVILTIFLIHVRVQTLPNCKMFILGGPTMLQLHPLQISFSAARIIIHPNCFY